MFQLFELKLQFMSLKKYRQQADLAVSLKKHRAKQPEKDFTYEKAYKDWHPRQPSGNDPVYMGKKSN